MKTGLIWVAALFVFSAFGFMVWQKESILRHGRTVYLELAPVDPRSLMQGDYMALNYALARSFRQWDGEKDKPEAPRSGVLVIELDARGAGRFLRLHQGETLNAKEQLLRFHHVGRRVAIGAESYFFQERTGESYAGAKYGELKVSANGTPLLVALCDGELKRKGPKEGSSVYSKTTTP